jgi:mannose-6-phosphate isomerase-like protein (cupin superfamily)
MMPDKSIQEQLQDYCLGFLSAEEMAAMDIILSGDAQLAAEFKAYQGALENFALQNAITPSAGMKNKIITLIDNLSAEENFTLQNTPVINQYSDYRNWMKVVSPLLPEKLTEDVFAQVIRQDEKITQTLIKTKVDYPDEVHEEVYESFIVLEGECECYIGNKVVRLGPGGFISIPLHQHHDVKVLTPYVVAIQQRIAV